MPDVADLDIPRLAFPPRFEHLADGSVRLALVEQDSPDDTRGQARLLAHVPIGWRDELMDFGTPRDEFGIAPVNTPAVRDAFETWLPGVLGDIGEQGDVADQAMREVRAEIIEGGPSA